MREIQTVYTIKQSFTDYAIHVKHTHKKTSEDVCMQAFIVHT